MLVHARLVAVTKNDGQQPADLAALLLRLRVGKEAPLPKNDLLAALAGAHQRIADLPDPAVGQLEDGLPRRLGESAPQIVGGRVGLAVLAHVQPDSVAEPILAQVALDHPEDRATLLVGDGVERLACLLRVLHLGADGVRALERVEVQGGALADLEIHPHAPGWLPGVDDLVGHPGGERLVEPEVVPPDHGDEIAEPLMRELVRDHLSDALLHVERRGLRIEQERHFPERDGRGVLHRARLEVGNSDLVQLAVRVRLAEVVLEERQDGPGAFLRESRQVLLGGNRPGADGHVADDHRFAGSQLPGADRDQVARERRRLGEGHRALAAVLDAVLRDPSVRDRRDLRRKLQELDLPAGLERRLVEAGKHAPRISRLELGHGDRTGPVQPPQSGREPAAPLEVEGGSAGRQLLVEQERDGLALLVRLDARRRKGLSRRAGARAFDLQLHRVQRQLAARLGEIQLDLEPAFEGSCAEVGGEMRAVPDRAHVERKAEILAEGQCAPPGTGRGCTAFARPRRAQPTECVARNSGGARRCAP